MNLQKASLLALTLACVGSSNASAIDLRLPYKADTSLVLQMTYNTFTHTGKDAYALDFADGCNAWDKDVLAAESGVVTRIVTNQSKTDYPSYGNYVVIDHGNGYTSLYAHLNKVTVSSGSSVQRGDVIGTIGNSGYAKGELCSQHKGTHLHFVVRHNAAAYKPEPISGYTQLEQLQGARLTSDNRPPQKLTLTRIGDIAWYPAASSCINAQRWFRVTPRDGFGLLKPEYQWQYTEETVAICNEFDRFLSDAQLAKFRADIENAFFGTGLPQCKVVAP